ncbi:YidC/Oxa1 family membrane protein insertase [Candidatus Gottesmanbacteria bacterium]|nr:YidC/Oxa1 family membrane protein insertase [Candidatus Gottesmanbacteria bacterium]
MFDPNNFFNSFFVIPILNALIVLYKLLEAVKIPGAFGFALILLTVLIRLILNPLTATQLRSTQKLSRLKPEIDRLTEKYKNDKGRLHQEQLKLYQQAGINPAAGCLPLLVQMPILIALYNLFFQILNNGNLAVVTEGINKVVYLPFLKISSLDLTFLGLNLAHKPSEWQKLGWWLLLVPIVTGLLQYWQTKMMTPKNASLASSRSAGEAARSASTGQVPKKEEDMGTMMQKQMSLMMPLMIGYFGYIFPLGLSLYWNTFTVFGIIQQYQLSKEKEVENGKNRQS